MSSQFQVPRVTDAGPQEPSSPGCPWDGPWPAAPWQPWGCAGHKSDISLPPHSTDLAYGPGVCVGAGRPLPHGRAASDLFLLFRHLPSVHSSSDTTPRSLPVKSMCVYVPVGAWGCPEETAPHERGWTRSPQDVRGSHSQKKPNRRVESWPRRLEPSNLPWTLPPRGPEPVPACLLASVSQLYQEGLNAELRKRALSVDAASCSLLAGWGVGGGHAAGRAAGPGRAGHSPGNLPSSSALAAHRRPQGGARGSQRPLASARARRRGALGCGAHGAASRPRRARGSAATAAARAAPIVLAAPRHRPLGPRCSVPPGSGLRPGGRGQPRPRPLPAPARPQV